jgi:hypothetical protein
MKIIRAYLVGISILLTSSLVSFGEIKVIIEHNEGAAASDAFKFKKIPTPSQNDAATNATFTIVDGARDRSGGGLRKLNDGQLPTDEDQPEENFFFQAGSDGGRVLVDLHTNIDISEVNSYSWHPGSRGPQVYKLYASAGTAKDFNSKPTRTNDPVKSGWKLLANVDSRPKTGNVGGQYGVSITNSHGTIGKYRYLLFDISATASNDDFAQTFYSEIDIVEKNSKPQPIVNVAGKTFRTNSTDGKCEIVIDSSRAPDLDDWAQHTLAPALAEWYPKICAMLASDGYTPPARFSVRLAPGNGVAATGGTRITANSTWLKTQIGKEAVGSLIHEEVHVIQQYGRARRSPDATDDPGWLVEGIPDYIRFYFFEPQTHGANIRPSNVDRVHYDDKYRTSANFLNFVSEKYDKEIVKKVNAVLRDGNYRASIWKDNTGKTLQELADEWKANLKAQAPAPRDSNSKTNGVS